MANERRLNEAEREIASNNGYSEERLERAYICPEGRGFFKKEKTGTDGYLLLLNGGRDRCELCRSALPADILKKLCCGVGDVTPGPNHELSCENHKPLDFSVPTHVDEAGRTLCAGLINATELVAAGCPTCNHPGEKRYCPTCRMCICGTKNDGRSKESNLDGT